MDGYGGIQYANRQSFRVGRRISGIEGAIAGEREDTVHAALFGQVVLGIRVLKSELQIVVAGFPGTNS